MRPPARALLLLALLLAGCTEYWAKPGGTPAELQQAKALCETEAYARFPPVLQTVMVSAGYFAPPQKTCTSDNGKTRCVTTGGVWVPPTFQTIDINQDPRNSARIACMTVRGWILADSEKEAAAITRGGVPGVPSGGGAAVGSPGPGTVPRP